VSAWTAVSLRLEPLIRGVGSCPCREPDRYWATNVSRVLGFGVALALSDKGRELVRVECPHASNTGSAGKLAAQGALLDRPLRHAEDASGGR
jgi:hypothetical protein